MHSIVAAGIQAQLLSNWTASLSIGQMELIIASVGAQGARRDLRSGLCTRHECCRVPHAIPPPDAAQVVEAQVEVQLQAQAQAAADRSARDERGRPRVVAHLLMQ
ncbi:hypothetical protein B0H14DRAFT_3884687 [Mycena olivaceomarginata]|nr:hypothetical protein B0H14DRAFT_3884687 [Mycena olivaceomarginata]